MKNFKLLLLISSLFALTSCSNDYNFSISGHISNAENEYIYLDELKVSSTIAIDSMRIKNNGEFKFEGNVKYPSFYLLRLSQNNFITLLVDSAENIVINADAANFGRKYVVQGSEGSKHVQNLNYQLSKTKHSLDSIRTLLAIRQGNNKEEFRTKLDLQYKNITNEQIEYSKKFIEEHPFSMANVLALYQKFDNDSFVIDDLKSLQIVATSLNSMFPESEHVKALYNNTTELMKYEEKHKLRELINKHGENCPEINLPNHLGKNIALSSFRGKYVLLQFWASKDRNSRILNPILLDVFNKYQNREFAIYQVSIDENKEEWEAALKNDNILKNYTNWQQLCDFEGNGNAKAIRDYNVTVIPFNYLLDKEGKIIAKNLIGTELEKVLKNAFR